MAGVSVPTASRVFDSRWNGHIHEQKRQAVLNAAKELGYLGTNALFRSIHNRQTNIIALVVGSELGYFYQSVVMKFVHALREKGKQVLIFEVDAKQSTAQIISDVYSYQVDAVILTSAATEQDVVGGFEHTGKPLIIFDRLINSSEASCVYCDARAAAGKAADFLMEQGHSTFCVISGNANASKEFGRIEGFCERIKQRGGEILEVAVGDYTIESGYRLAGTLLKRHRPDALFCAEDIIAMGAMDAARQQLHWNVPEDLSVMGYDGSPVSGFYSYNLTTVQYPVDEMIECAVCFMELLLKDNSCQSIRVFEPEIFIGSTVKLKGDRIS